MKSMGRNCNTLPVRSRQWNPRRSNDAIVSSWWATHIYAPPRHPQDDVLSDGGCAARDFKLAPYPVKPRSSWGLSPLEGFEVVQPWKGIPHQIKGVPDSNSSWIQSEMASSKSASVETELRTGAIRLTARPSVAEVIPTSSKIIFLRVCLLSSCVAWPGQKLLPARFICGVFAWLHVWNDEVDVKVQKQRS